MTNLFGATKCQNWVLSFKDNCQGEGTVWTQKSYYRHNCSKVCRPCKAKTSTGDWANITSSKTTHSALGWIPFRAPGLQAAKMTFSKQMPAVCLSVKAPANFNKHLGAHFLCPCWFLPGGWSGTYFSVFHTWRDNTWMPLWPSCYTNRDLQPTRLNRSGPPFPQHLNDWRMEPSSVLFPLPWTQRGLRFSGLTLTPQP